MANEIDSFSVERQQFLAGESYNEIEAGTHIISMADSPTTSVEWGVDKVRTRKNSLVFAGDTWVCPQGQRSWVRREEDKECIQMKLSTQWLSSVTHNSSCELVPQAQIRDLFLAQMLRNLSSSVEVMPDDPITTLYRESLALTVVLHLTTHYGQEARRQSKNVPLCSLRLRVITDYVAEHLAETVSVTELAQLAGLSVSQFSLRFRETTGQTPHQFVTTLRIERAMEMLASGKHTPGNVALMTGFADQSHLTRHFRRTFGVTPGAVKRH